MKHSPSAENQSGYSKSAFLIFWNSATMVFSSKGRYPARSTYRMTPMLHTSAAVQKEGGLTEQELITCHGNEAGDSARTQETPHNPSN
jgi:hypothetical protein